MADDLSARLRALREDERRHFPRGAYRQWALDGDTAAAAKLDEHEAWQREFDAAVDALDAAPPPGEGTVEWGVRYEYMFDKWRPNTTSWSSRDLAEMDARHRRRSAYYRNVEVVSRRRNVTDWQPVEPQP